MPTPGGYSWANRRMGRAFGDVWQADKMGQSILKTSLYDRSIAGDRRTQAYNGLMSYMQRYYGVDFEDWFDWARYRKWYDHTR